MQVKFFALAGLASVATAQSLIQALNSSSDLSALAGLVTQYNLAGALANLNNVTILAPNNAAISQFLAGLNNVTPTADQFTAVLQYHILNGTYQNLSSNPAFVATNLVNPTYANVTGGQRVETRSNTTIISGLNNNSTAIGAPVNFTGGVVHVINRVLTVPGQVGATALSFNLTAFYGALNATGLLNTVNGLGGVTIFAPNNAAFQRIGSGLGNLTTQQAQSILQYHIINGTVAYSTLLSNTSVPSLQGTNLSVRVNSASSVFINNARVVLPNVLIGGGVLHVIDEVLNPQNTTAATGTASAGQPAFSGASSVSTVPYATGQPTATSIINTSAAASSATAAASSSSSAGAWVPRPTAAVGAALGGLALLMQL